MNIIYISNTRIPSEKANTYQSMVMCEAFANNNCDIEFWYPNMRNSEAMEKIDDPYKFYNISKIFKTIKIGCIDSDILYENTKLHKYWFLLRSFSFAISYIFKLRKTNQKSIVFTRDMVGLNILSLAKKLKIIKQKVYFEAHVYSKTISNNTKNIDGLIVINNYLKELYVKDGINNILVAHDGVKIETFKETQKIKAKELLNFEQDIEYLTYVGRFNTMGNEKGIPEIIESLQYIKDLNIKLLCIGGPLENINEYYNIAKRYDIKRDKLVFIDRQPVSEVYKYISASSILLMPFPWTEHYAYFMSPLKMFEYMASKRPIVASRLPSIEEVLQDKQNAILCEPDNPKDLANKITWLLNHDCEKIVNQAYEDVQEYTWYKRAENIIRWIDEK